MTSPAARAPTSSLTERVPNVANDKGVELKGGMYAFMSLRIDTVDLARIDAILGDKVQQAPGFFRDTPVVLDLTPLTRDPEADDPGPGQAPGAGLDAAALIACIRRHHLIPLVASVTDKSSPLAASVALPLIEGGQRRQTVTNDASGDASGDGTSSHDVTDVGEPDDTQARQERRVKRERRAASRAGLSEGGEIEYVARTPMIVDRPVRSGQQLYARDTDLIVIGQVGPGAEVIADHNIHVYGPLRGRALCGVSGNTSTRIFCQSLEAELVSVAGNYRMLETIPADLRGKPAKIALDNDRLSIEPL